MTLGAERFDCGPHILTSPESRNKSTELHVKPSDFNVELVRGKDKMDLFLCCHDTYRFSFPWKTLDSWDNTEFPCEAAQPHFSSCFGSMTASGSSGLHCEGQVFQTESKWHREYLLYIFPELFLYKNNTKLSKIFKILKRMQICEFLF